MVPCQHNNNLNTGMQNIMNKIRLELKGTRSPTSHRNIVIEFVTYVPNTNVNQAKSYVPEGFRKV